MSQTYAIISPSDVALKPPPGVVPDFQDPFTVRPYWIVTSSLGLVAASILLALRLYTKIVVVKKLRWEDYTCVLGFLFYAAFVALIFKVVDAKAGAHQWNLTTQDIAQQYFYYNFSDLMYSPAVGFTKISIILLVIRIFCPTKRDPFYWALQGLNILNIIFYTIYFIIPIVECHPRMKIWQPKSPGSCLQIFDLYIISGVFNVCSDIAMYSAPLWKIWHLHMSRGRRLGMMAVFATGGVAIVFSIFRLIWAVLLLKNEDFSYVKMQACCFGVTELATGLMVSCMFVLPRLYRHVTAQPPYDSEEHRLRKWKKLASMSKGGNMNDSKFQQFHRKEEERNPWERDIEAAGAADVMPKALHLGGGGLQV